MKRVISVSLGNSKFGNEIVHTEFLGEEVCLARIGVDGDMKKEKELLIYFDSLDEKGKSPLPKPQGIDIDWLDLTSNVDAMGLGGTDLKFWRGRTFREGRQLTKHLKKVPLLCGYGVKMTLERHVVNELMKTGYLGNPKVLLASACDREGMAIGFNEALKAGQISDLVLGDLMYVLGINRPLRRLEAVERVAKILSPVIANLPVSLIYPMGKKQEIRKPKFLEWQEWADVIAGDCHMILKRIAPRGMYGKVLLVNTTTQKIIDELRALGFKAVITTTPRFKSTRGEGYRTFGTNLIEAMWVAFGADPNDYSTYFKFIIDAGFGPNIIEF